jgi:hypothetical protein
MVQLDIGIPFLCMFLNEISVNQISFEMCIKRFIFFKILLKAGFGE